ncbi:MAG: transposase [Streptosporangiaceae bacterium]
MTSRRAYRTDLSDARWALIGPVLSAWRAARAGAGLGLSPPVHELREIVNAILYVNRTGMAWEYLPHDFPPYKTVYDYYAKWEAGGTTEAVHDLLRAKVREQAGRAGEPTAPVNPVACVSEQWADPAEPFVREIKSRPYVTVIDHSAMAGGAA